MPGFIARKLCPELIFVPVDFNKYTYYSNLTRKGYKLCFSMGFVQYGLILYVFAEFSDAPFGI